MRAVPQNGRGLGVDHLDRGSLNVRPAMRSEAAQPSGQKVDGHDHGSRKKLLQAMAE